MLWSGGVGLLVQLILRPWSCVRVGGGVGNRRATDEMDPIHRVQRSLTRGCGARPTRTRRNNVLRPRPNGRMKRVGAMKQTRVVPTRVRSNATRRYGSDVFTVDVNTVEAGERGAPSCSWHACNGCVAGSAGSAEVEGSTAGAIAMMSSSVPNARRADSRTSPLIQQASTVGWHMQEKADVDAVRPVVNPCRTKRKKTAAGENKQARQPPAGITPRNSKTKRQKETHESVHAQSRSLT